LDRKRLVLLQLPVPQHNQYKKTLNIPLAPAWIALGLKELKEWEVYVLSQEHATYLGDKAILDHIISLEPDAIGLSLYLWNTDRSLYLAWRLKELLGTKVIIGGPEVTGDNPYIERPWIDLMVVGEGEGVIRDILSRKHNWPNRVVADNQWSFKESISPYLFGLLSPGIENIMLLETQRGCPYGCTYCYYHKSFRSIKSIGIEGIEAALRWAVEHKVKEIYLMDPSFNIRKDFVEILQLISDLNKEKHFTLTTELRVEDLTEKDISLLTSANFNMIEIGLQSINQDVLKAVNRNVRLGDFLKSVGIIKKSNIQPKIDLILGLPLDTSNSFRDTLKFIVENDLAYDAELFLLSILPGTVLRKHAHEYKIRYQEHPPYHILSSEGLSETELKDAWEEAEDVLDTNFLPPPFLDIGYKKEGKKILYHCDGKYVTKVLIMGKEILSAVNDLASRLFHPYQIFLFDITNNMDVFLSVVNVFTSMNPHTPFEVIIFEPEAHFQIYDWIHQVKLIYPHYLDSEYEFKLQGKERGCITLSLVKADKSRIWHGYMTRQVYWWKEDYLPNLDELKALEHLDGVLLDGRFSEKEVLKWQQRYYKRADFLPAISFAEESWQRRWISMCYPEDSFQGPIFNKGA